MSNVKTTASEYAAARLLFEAGHKLRVIAEKTGIPIPRISKKAKADGWTKRREDHLGRGAAPSVVVNAEHVASDDTRKLVHAMAGFGLAEDQIAVIVGTSPEQLRTAYAHELASAPPRMIARVAQSLFQMATDANKPNVTAAMYLHNRWAGDGAAGKVEALGKKEVKLDKAKRAASGKYTPTAAPKLVAASGKVIGSA